MAKVQTRHAQRKRRRRQKGLLTAFGLVFAVSAVLRLGALDFAFAEAEQTDVSSPSGIDHRAADGLGVSRELIGPLQEALSEIQSLRSDVTEREAALRDREQAIAIAQALVEERLAELEATEIRLQALIAQSDGAAEMDLEQLTRVYETMDPAQAAAVFSEMSPSFAAGFLSRMTPATSAALLAEMTPADAYAVSVIIATRNASAPRLSQPTGDTEN